MEVATTPAALSQNINLFQSLRVLQEGENGEDASALSNRKYTFYISYIMINEIDKSYCRSISYTRLHIYHYNVFTSFRVNTYELFKLNLALRKRMQILEGKENFSYVRLLVKYKSTKCLNGGVHCIF